MKKRSSLAKKSLKFLFYGAAAAVGVLIAVSAVKRKGKLVGKEGKKLLRKTRYAIDTTTGKLNARQKRILSLFDREDKITNEMIGNEINDVSERTIRRDLTTLSEKGYIKQVGKTKGSHYELM
ncbi:DeoR family transcriptional regulator [Candidatus Dojkabacteria bacterium]|nr:DeoR family transcriptional regulator [Candidatus Dojkabacteria bacterium]